MTSLDQLLTEIAREHLLVPTLVEQKSDQLDFHNVSVWGIRAALLAAYQSGAGTVARPRDPQLPLPFDDYEIHGVVEFRGEDGTRYCEPAPDEEAHFWSLYGHLPGQGLECIGDFQTRHQAEEIYARISGRPYAPSR